MAISKFLKESRQEIKKVTWPTRKDTVRYTIMVVVASLIVAAYLGGVDALVMYVIRNFVL